MSLTSKMEQLKILGKLKLKAYTAQSFKKYWDHRLELSNTRRKQVHYKTLIVVYESWRKRLIARVFYLEEGYLNLKPYRNVMEVARYLSGSNKKLVRNMSSGLNGSNVNSILNYEISRNGGWSVHNLFSFDTESTFSGWHYIEHIVHIDYKEVIQDTNVKYSAVELLDTDRKLPDYIFNYLSKYVKYPILEIIIKKGWLHLLNDLRLLRLSKNTLPEIVGVPKQDFWMIDIGLDLSFIRENRSWILNEKLTEEETLTFKREYQLHNIKLKKRLIKYLTDQSNSYSYYSDYILFACDLGYELNRKSVLYPENLVMAHNEAYSQIEMNKEEVNKEKFYAQYELNKKYEFDNDEFIIMVAKKQSELQIESKLLNHCVRTYAENIVGGETTILFVRKKEEPDVPLVTVELKNKKVIQARGKNNGYPSDEIKDFLRSWSKAKKVTYI